MKKILFFIMMFVVFTLTSCNDDCDHISGGSDEMDLVGTWFSEDQNEEIRFSSGNTFYFRFCFTQRAYEGEGIYEVDGKNKRMTLTYNYLGYNQYLDWKIVSYDDYGFTESSEEEGSHHYHKVVETYNLEIGKTANIKSSSNLPSSTVLSFKSLNENIAKVSSDGTITVTGEKGTAYILVEMTGGTVVVKAVVGIDRCDLWVDYSVLLGKSVSEMRKMLGSPTETSEDAYGYLLPVHDILDYIVVFLDSKSKKVDEVYLYILNSVPSSEIMSYLKDKYYLYKDYGDEIWYMTSPKLSDSRAVYAYYKNSNVIVIFDPNSIY